jgi:hypothetical protein
MNSFEQQLQDDDIYISEEIIGRLHRASEDTVLELVAAFQDNRRASLAMQCYRKLISTRLASRLRALAI